LDGSRPFTLVFLNSIRAKWQCFISGEEEHPEKLGVYSGYPTKCTHRSDEESIDRETNIHSFEPGPGVRSPRLGRLSSVRAR
jgi:hypothetical protein